MRVADAARLADISVARWSQIETGQETRHGVRRPVNAKAGTIAHMAYAVGVTPERLAAEGGRPDAADVLREILLREDAGRGEAEPASVPDEAAQNVMDTMLGEDESELAPYIGAVRAAVRSAEARYGPEPTGEQVFPHDEDASGSWNVDVLPKPVRIKLVAVIWLLRDQNEERDRAARERNPGRVKRPA